MTARQGNPKSTGAMASAAAPPAVLAPKSTGLFGRQQPPIGFGTKELQSHKITVQNECQRRPRTSPKPLQSSTFWLTRLPVQHHANKVFRRFLSPKRSSIWRGVHQLLPFTVQRVIRINQRIFCWHSCQHSWRRWRCQWHGPTARSATL